MGRIRFVLVAMVSVLLASLTLGQARASDDGAAVAATTSTCTDGVDNDGDGLTDGADPDCDEGEQNVTQCNDGVDNDGDGLTDVNDPDCKGGAGSSEFPGGGGLPPECTDGVDNDNDGLTDGADPDCDKGSGTAACADGVDNDGDGLTDLADPDCKNSSDDSEAPAPDSCADGVDNDGDGLTDDQDPDCDEGPPPAAQCDDGADNDGDGAIDFPADPGCTSATDDDETDGPPTPQCADGVDNDGDGAIDFPADPGCTSATDDDETNTVVDNCTAAAGDPGLAGNNTIAQQVFDSPLGAIPVLQDPDRDGPLSSAVNGAGNGTPLEVLTDEVSCVANLPVLDL